MAYFWEIKLETYPFCAAGMGCLFVQFERRRRSPIQRKRAFAHVAMEGRVWPIARAFGVVVLHGVVVDVIDVV